VDKQIKISVKDLNISYDSNRIVRDLNIDVYANNILTIIGPANSGKSSFLRAINRLHDINPDAKVTGTIKIDEKDIYKDDIRLYDLRKMVGMIFATPTPLPMSIYDNLVYGPKLHGISNKQNLSELVEESLKAASLWDEVKDRLDVSAICLSGGQQQRLCIARALTVKPEIIMFDEPCSGLDPISTSKVEATMLELKKQYTIILVTNNVKQAARVGDQTAFFLMGEMVEVNKTAVVFTTPSDQRTNDYITGRFG